MCGASVAYTRTVEGLTGGVAHVQCKSTARRSPKPLRSIVAPRAINCLCCSSSSLVSLIIQPVLLLTRSFLVSCLRPSPASVPARLRSLPVLLILALLHALPSLLLLSLHSSLSTSPTPPYTDLKLKRLRLPYEQDACELRALHRVN